MRWIVLPVILALMVALVPNAQAVTVTAGWTDSDVGLIERGNGFYAGVMESWPLGGDFLEFSAAAEYIQRSGSLQRIYADPQAGPVQGEAKVTLHHFQPAGFVRLKVPGLSFIPRIYTGFSLALNLSESWDEPQGETIGDYGYEQMDMMVHFGASLEFSRILVDFRYSQGLTEQLIEPVRTLDSAAKALPVEYPENGAKTSGIQIGIGYSF